MAKVRPILTCRLAASILSALLSALILFCFSSVVPVWCQSVTQGNLLSASGTAHPTVPTVNHTSGHPSASGTQAVASTQVPVSKLPADATLNLGSTLHVLQAPNQSVVKITQGHKAISIQPGSSITAAEFLAVQEVLQTNKQTLTLNAQGAASGGYAVVTNSDLQSGLAALTIPAHVSLAAIGFTNNSPLSVHGNTILGGSLYALQNQTGLMSVLNLGTLTIAPGGMLSAAKPLNLSIPNTVSSAGLTVNVQGNVLNQGILSSPGQLNIYASGNIANLSTSSGSAVLSATSLNINSNTQIINKGLLTAIGDVRLFAATGSITNTGTVSSLMGNINAECAANSKLDIANSGGILQALHGAINARDSQYQGSNSTAITGGNLLSDQVNLNGGTGAVTVDVGQLTGTVNTKACSVHLNAATSNLELGNTSISGDPSYYNAAGSITIGSSIAFAGQDLAIVASQDIYTTSSTPISISTANSQGNGGSITLIAGARVSTTGGSQASNNTTSTLTVFGPSSTGGAIDLTRNGGLTHLSSASTGSTGNGGNVTMIAYRGSGVNSPLTLTPGSINSSSSVTSVEGSPGGKSGNVLMIAGAQTSNPSQPISAISTGFIRTLGASSSGGAVTISAAQPTITGGSGVVSIRNGTILSGSGGFASSTANGTTAGTINIGGIIDARTVNISSTNNGNIVLSSTVSGTSTTIAAGGSGNISQNYYGLGILSPSITLSSGSGNIGSSGSSPQGALTISGGAHGPTSLSVNISQPNNTGNASIDFQGESGTLLNVNASHVGGNLSITTLANRPVRENSTNDSIHVVGPVSANTVVLSTLSASHNNNGDIAISAPVVGNSTVSVTAGGSGSISLAAPVTANWAMSLVTSGTGSITRATNTAVLASPSIWIYATGGNIGTSVANPLLVKNGLDGPVSFAGYTKGTGSIFVQNINAGALTLNYMEAGGTIYVNNNGGNVATGRTYGSIIVASTMVAPTLILTTTSANGLNSGDINIKTPIYGVQSITLGAGGYGNIYTEQNYSNVYINSPVVAINLVNGHAGSGQQIITLGNFYYGAPYYGAPPSPLSLSVNASAPGNSSSAFFDYNSNNDLLLNSSSLGGSLSISTQSFVVGPNNNLGITVVGRVSVGSATISTVSGSGNNNGNITVAAAISALQNVSLLAGGTGSITQTQNATSISAGQIELATQSGSIGKNTAYLQTATNGVLSVRNYAGTTAGINVSNTGNGVTLWAPQSAGNMNIYNSGSMRVVGSGSTRNGSILLSVQTGNLTIDGSSLAVFQTGTPTSLTANNGDIALQNQDTTLSHQASIAINSASIKGSSTTAGVGNVYVVFGSNLVAPNLLTSRPNLSVIASGGANVYVGTNGITTNAPGSTLNAEGRYVILSTANRPASAITLSGANIVADPPMIEPAAAISSHAVGVIGDTSSTGYTGNTGAAETTAGRLVTTPAPYALLPKLLSSTPNFASLPGLAQVIHVIGDATRSALTGSDKLEACSKTRTSADGGAQQQACLQNGAPEDVLLYMGRQDTATGSDSAGIGSGSACIWSDSARIGSDSTGIRLQRGSVLCAPSSDLQVDNAFAQIKIGRKAVVLVVAQNNGISVYNLHDRHSNQVTVTTAHGTIALVPGQHVTIARTANYSFENVNPLECISHRALQIDHLASGLMRFDSEFSIASALSGLQLLSQMRHSLNTGARHIIETVEKTEASIQVIKTGSGKYERFSTPNRNLTQMARR